MWWLWVCTKQVSPSPSGSHTRRYYGFHLGGFVCSFGQDLFGVRNVPLYLTGWRISHEETVGNALVCESQKVLKPKHQFHCCMSLSRVLRTSLFIWFEGLVSLLRSLAYSLRLPEKEVFTCVSLSALVNTLIWVCCAFQVHPVLSKRMTERVQSYLCYGA